MRILHVNDYRARGGCEVVVDMTVEMLAAAGHDVDVLYGDDRDGRSVRPSSPLAYIDSRHHRRRVALRVGAFRPDIVHVHNFYHVLSPGVLGALDRWRRDTGGAVVMTAHDYHLVCPNAGFNRFRQGVLAPADPSRVDSLGYLIANRWDHRGLRYSTMKLAQHVWNYRVFDRRRFIDLVCCGSRFVERTMRHAGLRTALVPQPVPSMSPRDRAPGALRLVYAGRLEPEKGIERFLEHAPPGGVASLTIVGDGSLRPRLESMAERCWPGRVHFTGALSRAQTIDQIAAAHALVLPSVCLETSGLVLVEALAAGTNIVASRRGAMAEVLDDTGVGFGFDPDSPATIADAMAAVRRAHDSGVLNRFDAHAYLSERRPETYLASLLAWYTAVRGQGGTGAESSHAR